MNGELSWDEGGSPLHAGQPSRCRRRIPLSNTILLPPASRVLFSIPRYGKEVFRMQKKQFWPVEALTVTAMLIACQVVLGNLLQVPLLGKQYNFGDGIADVDTRLDILAGIETKVLGTYNYIPVLQDGSVALLSRQVYYVVEDYNPVMGRGGIAYMRYNYNETDWAAYVAAQENGQVKY
jgi:hypothetical protein